MGFEVTSFAAGMACLITPFFIAWVLGLVAHMLNIGCD